MLVPVEIIEKLVSREMARRYLQFDIKVDIYSSAQLFCSMTVIVTVSVGPCFH